jgi:hypothetical protein
VADGIEVQPVLVHDLTDLPAAHPPHVDERGIVLVRDLADPLVEQRHPPAQRLEHRIRARVGDGEHDDLGARVGETADRLVVCRGECVEIDARAKHVVPATVDRDEVRVECQRRLELFGQDRGQLASADGEVGIAEVRGRESRLAGEHLGDPVGPTAEAVGAALVGVTDPFGERVAEGDVAVEQHGVEPTTRR